MKIKNFLYYVILLILINLTTSAQWVQLTSGTSQNLRSVFFTGAQTGYACGESGTLIKTTNSGANWSPLNPGTAYNLRSVHFVNSSTGLCCGYAGAGGIIIRTTNAGANWSTVYTGSAQLTNLTFSHSPNAVCVGNSGTTLYSTDGGASWQTGQPTGYLVTFYTSYMINTSTGYCGGVNTIFSPLFAKTTNGGANWTYSTFMVNNNEATIMDMHFFNEMQGIAVSVLWNGTGGISKTTNGGTNWTHLIVTPALYGIDFPGTQTGYIAGSNGAIYKTTDAGNNWTAQNSGISSFLRCIDFVDTLLGFAAGDGGVILKTTNGGVTALKPVSNTVPKDFMLYQNYPNPFNPATKIVFAVPPSPQGEGKGVRVTVYYVLGREIAVLVNEKLLPGTYEVEWDGTNYPSGVYYYTISSKYFSETKKMVLIK